jgi:predicted aspartyl protease
MLVARCKLERRQAIIDIGIQPFPLEIPGVSAEAQPPKISITSYRALIDTGAQRTCLTNRTIAAEGLVRHGHKFIRNVHSDATHSLFMASIGIYGSDGDAAWAAAAGRSYFGIEEPVEVINIADNENFDAILGMDVLENYSFRFDKNGDFELHLA